MKNKPCLVDIHSYLRVGRSRGAKRFQEARFEVLQSFETAAELRMDGGPRNRCGFAELVAAPCEPYIDIKAHGTIAELPDSGF